MHGSHVVTAEAKEPPAEPGGKPGIWRRWVVAPVIGQLKQGISPDKLGWTIGAGIGLGICPVLGTRAWLCLLAGWWFKLNQPVLHIFKSMAYPLHVALIIPFIQMGQWLYGKDPMRISLEIIRAEVARDLWGFLGEFGWMVLRAASAWALLAPLVVVMLKFILTPVLRRAGVRWKVRPAA